MKLVNDVPSATITLPVGLAAAYLRLVGVSEALAGQFSYAWQREALQEALNHVNAEEARWDLARSTR